MGTKVVTGKVRFSFANIFEPKAIDEGSEPKYSLNIIIPKTDTATIKAINDAVAEAEQEAKNTKFGGKIPATLKRPLRDGDLERPDDPNYANSYFINASSKNRPRVVDANVQPILDPDEVYSGCYGRVSINFYGFAVSGNKGIASGLNNIQKLEDGERLSGGSTPEEDFGDSASLLD